MMTFTINSKFLKLFRCLSRGCFNRPKGAFLIHQLFSAIEQVKLQLLGTPQHEWVKVPKVGTYVFYICSLGMKDSTTCTAEGRLRYIE